MFFLAGVLSLVASLVESSCGSMGEKGIVEIGSSCAVGDSFVGVESEREVDSVGWLEEEDFWRSVEFRYIWGLITFQVIVELASMCNCPILNSAAISWNRKFPNVNLTKIS